MIDNSALLAPAASLNWVFSQLYRYKPALYYGSLQFNRIPMIIASILLIGVIWLTGEEWCVSSDSWGWIIVSGILGIGLGDYFLFIAMERLEPRRTGVFAITRLWLLLRE